MKIHVQSLHKNRLFAGWDTVMINCYLLNSFVIIGIFILIGEKNKE